MRVKTRQPNTAVFLKAGLNLLFISVGGSFMERQAFAHEPPGNKGGSFQVGSWKTGELQ